MLTVTTPAQMLRWKIAIFAIFFASGLSLATWASRVPAIKAALGIDNMQVGLMLLGSGVGSLVGLSCASFLMARIGARIAMPICMLIFATGVFVIGIGADTVHIYFVVVLGLFLFGFGNGAVDVMMNVEGGLIESQTGKTILPMFHGFFSIGTVAGAGIGAAAIALHLSVTIHALVMALIIAAIACAVPFNVPASEAEQKTTESTTWRERLSVTLSAWKEPRTYGIGLVMLGMSFAEGGAGDWLALSMVEDHGAQQATGAVGLAIFSVSMTLMRLFGGPLVDRFGRVAVLRVLSLSAASGVLLFILAPNLPLVFVGIVLWGFGVSLGFPLGMSAAADDPAKAAARVSAAATIGYVAFLCGPPLLGLVSERIGLSNTLFVLVGLAVISGLASPAAREAKPERPAVAESPN